MVPFLAAAASGDTMKKVGIVVGAGALLGLGYWGYKSYQKKANQKQAARKYGDGSKEGKAVEYAGQIYSALHAGWFNMVEDEKSLYKTALEMHKNGVNMRLVGDAYRDLYSKELIMELNRLLKPEELTIFNNALNGKYQPVSQTAKYLKAASYTNPLLTPLTWFS
ncbi:hypothetical protein KDU71_02575 [Carboxylicivirga sediminis]|uniref:Uncharacterized protein n=1 Tax=Carboxylicivirga sediminis TaxID=2006564 RepID=A0A941F296_9BACT|nr:hypothetical protein [Carboxylicivirga sediminis]MBR8534430.1 hypothetical protein [Carboxylicivirga sediminis]